MTIKTFTIYYKVNIEHWTASDADKILYIYIHNSITSLTDFLSAA